MAASFPSLVRQEAIHELVGAHARELSSKLQAHRLKLFPPEAKKQLRRFSSSEAAKLVGVNDGYLRRLSLEGKGPEVDVGPHGRRSYSIEDIQSLRTYLDASGKAERRYVPARSANEHLQVIAVVNFKGGSGKTTTSAHLAQYLALRGYRILAIDLDPQASLSALHGVQPEFDIGENETLYGAIRYSGQRRDLKEVIRRTYFTNLDLVPANLELTEFEHETPKALAAGHGEELFFTRMDAALSTVARPVRRRRRRLSAAARIPDDVRIVLGDSRPGHRSPADARCHVDVPVPDHDLRIAWRGRRRRRQYELRLDEVSGDPVRAWRRPAEPDGVVHAVDVRRSCSELSDAEEHCDLRRWDHQADPLRSLPGSIHARHLRSGDRGAGQRQRGNRAAYSGELGEDLKMARKNLLADLTQSELPAGNSSPGSKTEPFEARALFAAGRGAIGAVSRSIDQLKSQAVIELATHLIDASFIEDRLGTSPEDHASLLASIREHGQQVPILVRPNPQQEGRYQIAYGHRRLRAAIELERPVRAIVKPLTDEQLVVAQGQENSARTNLSFIERALFAAQLEAKRVQPRDNHGRPKRRQDRTLTPDFLCGQNSA